jgi:hypothetical protein
MPNFLVLEFYLLLLSGDDEGEGWNRLLHDDSVEDEGDNFSISIFFDMMTWRLLFSDCGIKTEMMSQPWNNFLHFVVVRSSHDEGAERIIFRSVFLTLRWQKEEEGRHQKRRSSSIPPTGILVVVRWAFFLRPFAECLPVRSSILQSI